MYECDEEFYQYINRETVDSATLVFPAMLAVLPEPVESVLDPYVTIGHRHLPRYPQNPPLAIGGKIQRRIGVKA